MSERPIILADSVTTTVLRPERFSIEARLQDLLEQHPEVLWLGELSESPPRLVPIGREVGVPSGSIDLLLLGSDGVLTLVETKLKRNEEARRTVVAQLLEYASYLSTWTVDDVEEAVRAYCAARGTPFDGLGEWLSDTFDVPAESEPLGDIAASLVEGRFRLVIALDAIPDPLRSLVTFVNRHSQFSILLLQVTSYPASDGRHVIVPDLFGYSPTRGSGVTPHSRSEPTWICDRETMVMAVQERGPEAAHAMGEIFDLAKSRYELRRGRGRYPSFSSMVRAHGRWVSLFSVEAHSARLYFKPTVLEEAVGELYTGTFTSRLRELFGQELREGQKGYYFSATLHAVGERLESFRDALDEVVAELNTDNE